MGADDYPLIAFNPIMRFRRTTIAKTDRPTNSRPAAIKTLRLVFMSDISLIGIRPPICGKNLPQKCGLVWNNGIRFIMSRNRLRVLALVGCRTRPQAGPCYAAPHHSAQSRRIALNVVTSRTRQHEKAERGTLCSLVRPFVCCVLTDRATYSARR